MLFFVQETVEGTNTVKPPPILAEFELLPIKKEPMDTSEATFADPMDSQDSAPTTFFDSQDEAVKAPLDQEMRVEDQDMECQDSPEVVAIDSPSPCVSNTTTPPVPKTVLPVVTNKSIAEQMLDKMQQMMQKRQQQKTRASQTHVEVAKSTSKEVPSTDTLVGQVRDFSNRPRLFRINFLASNFYVFLGYLGRIDSKKGK